MPLGNLDFVWYNVLPYLIYRVEWVLKVILNVTGSGVTANMVDPGFAETELSRHIDEGFSARIGIMLTWMVARTPKQAVEGILYASLSPNLSKTSGKYLE